MVLLQTLRVQIRGPRSLSVQLTCKGKCESGLQQQGPAQAQILPIPTKMLLTLNAEN